MATNPNEFMTVVSMSGIVDGERLTIRQWFHPPSVHEVEQALALACSLGVTRVRVTRSNLPVPF